MLLGRGKNILMEKALRYNQGKPQYSLIHYGSLEPFVRALEFGVEEYGRDNWKKGFSRESLVDSMLRHMGAIADGEELDQKSGLPHIGHLMANCMFYSYHYTIARSEEKEVQ